MTFGRTAYEAFKALDDEQHLGDDPLMDWQYVDEETRAKWEAAAKAARAVVWVDPVTGQRLIRAAEYDRPVWLLDIGKHTAEENEGMRERYCVWKAARS